MRKQAAFFWFLIADRFQSVFDTTSADVAGVRRQPRLREYPLA
jgi:hypothetical protein